VIGRHFWHSGRRSGRTASESRRLMRVTCLVLTARHDREAGHFFDVDEEKLERLRRLTRELRCGVEEVTGGYRSEYGDSSDDEDAAGDDGEAETGPASDEPWTASSGGRGDDELSDQPSSSSTRGRSAWFD